ncbi:MAG: phage tail assembly chaperone [Rhizobiales bacterium]|nr:phage tail assembly chaperone [Hyphomicrobiales bacterium]MBI3672361.1 phage tail assembly chaperone [Hyphomicrobiales bacterium]
MQLGLGVLRLAPRDFWRATPREIAAAFAAEPSAMERTSLEQLIARFPDGT